MDTPGLANRDALESLDRDNLFHPSTHMAGHARGETPALVIYHSHSNGRAYLSPTDREAATSPWGGPVYPVQQLVIGIDREKVTEAALFAWSDDKGGFAEIARYAGAAI